jgi:glucokinase
MRILAGDIGGTKTLLRLADGHDTVDEKRFESGAYATFSGMLGEFLSAHRADAIRSACFAVAGPVIGERAKVTNLRWDVDAAQLVREFGIGHVSLVNDFFAVARGVPLLGRDDVEMLNEGKADPTAPIAVIGAGTGLGQAFLVPLADNQWRVLPSEGGHCDFAPEGDDAIELLQYLTKKCSGHVSVERVVSGQGIANIYEFLTDRAGSRVEASEDLPAQVAQKASEGDALAITTFEMFMRAYGAEAGNMALKLLARGGVFLAGGVTAKNAKRLADGTFFEAFCDKGRFRSLMKEIPIALIRNERVGLLGALAVAAEQAR